ncbi:MAG: ferrous iron transport protein B [Planctomycetes bacterium]|nr:ferrous iron transport protein B [Planctomycetota bacterium]
MTATSPSPTVAGKPEGPLTVAVIGNPNTGKSTLFTALTGIHSRIGNYPGVTVEKKIGTFHHDHREIHLVDLPGTYSLSPRSLDEMVSVDVLLGRQADVGRIDVVICIADAANLERNLYLVSQVLDLGLPTVLILNMWDVAQSRGVQIDADQLSQKLGIPVVPCEAHRHRQIDAVKQAILTTAGRQSINPPRVFPACFYEEGRQLQAQLAEWGEPATPFYVAERMLLDVGGQIETSFLRKFSAQLPATLTAARERLKSSGFRVPAAEAKARYAWVREVLSGVMFVPQQRSVTRSDQLDQWLTHKVWGLSAFVVIMFAVFQSISTAASPLMELCEVGQQAVGGWVGSLIPPGPFQSLVVDGVIGGVGGILVFLPQICFLFLFIALLEDCGYMARAAFLMDKLMTKVGLSGKSFVPLMSSFACAIPGIMATRTIENRRDRMVTILIAPLMSCSARFPVYWLMVAAFFPDITWGGGWISLRGILIFVMTFFGAVVAVPVAWLFKKTLFKGETPPFVMELPSYKWPSPRIVLSRVYDRGKAFVVRAGTLIFATSILIWAASYFPGDHTHLYQLQEQVEQARTSLAPELAERDRLQKLQSEQSGRPEQTESLKELEQQLAATEARLEPLNKLVAERNVIAEHLLETSFLGRFGKTIEPTVRPLGWDWRIGVGVLASFPAREVIVSTLGTIYSLGNEVVATDTGLQQALRDSRRSDGRLVYSIPVALSIMVFFALCAQCVSTLMVIRRETNSWFWPLFTFTYMTTLAYVGAFAAYQLGSWLM